MILGFKEKFPNGNPTNFIWKIKTNAKKHSLREDIDRRWRKGVVIDMATGVRTKNYTCHFKKTCTGTQKIEIKYLNKDSNYPLIWIDGVLFVYFYAKDMEILQELAKNDGFCDFDDFCKWFHKDFAGKIIHWTNLRYKRNTYKIMQISPKAGFQTLAVEKKYKRNDTCPCGSGKKVKNCHPEHLETKYYSINPATTDSSSQEAKCKRDQV
jgi:hypothetical protein